MGLYLWSNDRLVRNGQQNGNGVPNEDGEPDGKEVSIRNGISHRNNHSNGSRILNRNTYSNGNGILDGDNYSNGNGLPTGNGDRIVELEDDEDDEEVPGLVVIGDEKAVVDEDAMDEDV